METIVIVLGIANALLLISLFIFIKKFRSVSKGFYNLFMSYTALLELSSSLSISEKEDAQDIHKENFIKFLSDSREWAYEYIDKVQIQLKDFIEKADKEFAFFDSYGILTQDQLFYENMKKISEEYKKLRALLPEEK